MGILRPFGVLLIITLMSRALSILTESKECSRVLFWRTIFPILVILRSDCALTMRVKGQSRFLFNLILRDRCLLGDVFGGCHQALLPQRVWRIGR